ncbi:hypothetical protein ACFYTF_18150 [Nocardia thailandica]|uniref:Uncharacterized protein n=1 Tax=Nocardia thailandica TaxID=257275 RepID=A0ABW6PQY0_9NOCA
MNHARILRTMLGVTAVYLVALALWLSWLAPHAPPGTLPYQVVIMVGLFGTCAGVGMLLSDLPSRADRRLRKHGLEGWAVIERVHPLARTDHHSELTELDLSLTVPGTESYRGTIVFDVMPVDRPRLEVGRVLSVRVDPADRDRIMVLPYLS